MDFQIKSTVQNLNIKNEAGETIKTFSLDIGNYDQMKAWSTTLIDLNKLTEEKAGQMDMDGVKETFEQVIPAILGPGSFEVLWEAFGQNLIVCAAFGNKLLEFITSAMEKARKDYV